MTWMKKDPTKPGWYWVRSGPSGHAWIVELYFGRNPPNTATQRLKRNSTLRVRHMGDNNGLTLKEYESNGKFLNIYFLPHEWYGPLESPH